MPLFPSRSGKSLVPLTSVLLWLLFLHAGCGVNEPITADKTKYRSAGQGGAGSESKGAINPGDKQPNADTGAPAAPSGDGVMPPSGVAATPTDKALESAAPAADSPDGSTETKQGKYHLPTGGVAKLIAFLEDLEKRAPEGRNQEEQLADVLELQNARLAAADKILTLSPTKEQSQKAIDAIETSHLTLVELDIKTATDRMITHGEELQRQKNPRIAQFGKLLRFQGRIIKIHSTKPETSEPFVAEVQNFLEAENKSRDAFVLANQVVQSLTGDPSFRPSALDMLRRIASLYKDHPDPELAQAAQDQLSMLRALDADLQGKVLAIQKGEAGAEQKLTTAVKGLLAEKSPSASLLQIVSQSAQLLEMSLGKYEAALSIYGLIGEAYKDHPDAELAKSAAHRATNAKKRVSLIGQPFVVQGVHLDGAPFDFGKYKGKLVLVDFWATWCGPCLQEVPNIRKAYDKYKAQGFEVIGVNLDSELENVEKFFSVQQLPWETTLNPEVVSKRTVADGIDHHPLVNQCGIDAIPFVLLIGRDGKVDSIHVRGPKIEARLKQLLSGGKEAADTPGAKDATPTTGEKEAAKKKAAETKDEKKAADAPAQPDAKDLPSNKLRGADSPPPATDGATKPGGSCGDEPPQPAPPNIPLGEAAAGESSLNPYLAKPDISAEQLLKYVEKMRDKPKSIQGRPGFAAAMVDACDRILAFQPPASDAQLLAATEYKLAAIHHQACAGDEAADKQLAELAKQLHADPRPRLAHEAKFLMLETKVLQARDLPVVQIPPLLKEVLDFSASEKMTAKHLRLASSTVALINKIENGDEREKYFSQFGALFAKSSDKQLARYGRKLAEKPETSESDLIGQPLELAGSTAKGNPFPWESYRGKVVIVDFWATWCGPCRKEMPHMKELYERLHAKGLEVVGVSLDQDEGALADYLAENQIPWETLAGDGVQELAKKYGVRGIPSLMLVDKQGKIIAVAHQLDTIVPEAEKLLDK